jgi:hypothetical protein
VLGRDLVIVQFTRALSAVPVKLFTTGRPNAYPEFGLESIATEMAKGSESLIDEVDPGG